MLQNILIKVNFEEFYKLYGKHFVVILSILVLSWFFSWLLKRLVTRYLRSSAQRPDADPTQLKFLRNAINFILLIIALVAIIYSIPDLSSFGATLFAGAGIFAAGLAFASQQAFANIVSGTFIVIFKPFRVDDTIAIGDLLTGQVGIVEDITLRHTVIRNFENRRVIIPNSLISTETIINSSIRDERIVAFVEVNITYNSDLKKAMHILRTEAEKHPLCIDTRLPEDQETTPLVVVRTVEMGEYFVKLRANVWTENNLNAFILKTDLYAVIIERFKEEGIEIAVPHRKVIVHDNKETLV